MNVFGTVFMLDHDIQKADHKYKILIEINIRFCSKM